jgi:hypothetical protein
MENSDGTAWQYKKPRTADRVFGAAGVGGKNRTARLFLPGTLLVTIQAQLLAPFVFVDFSLAAFFQ